MQISNLVSPNTSKFLVFCTAMVIGSGFLRNQSAGQILHNPPRRSDRRENATILRGRLHYRTLQQKDDAGVVPKNALTVALQALQSDKATAQRLSKATVAGVLVRPLTRTEESQLATAGLEKHPWTSLGPGGVGGRTRSIVISPEDPGRMWAGSVSGGIWFADRTHPFHPVNDLMLNLAISTMVMSPANHNVIFAGTGEGYSYIEFGTNGVNTDTIEDAKPGNGIFWCQDASVSSSGGTWNPLPFTLDNPDFRFVNRLAISQDGQVLLAATLTGLFRHDNQEPDAWPNMLPGIQMYTVAFAPGSSNNAVATGKDASGAVRVFYSTNGGKTWPEARQNPVQSPAWGGRVELAYAAYDPTIVYASVDNDAGQIWRSDNSGVTYTQRRAQANNISAHYLEGQGYYGNTIWAGDPNTDFIVIGGVDLWKSSDGGNTLTQISNWRWSDSIHADHHFVVAHPLYNGRDINIVFFGNDGGVYEADDIHQAGTDSDHRSGWSSLDSTYEVTQFYGGAASADGKQVIAGAQDNGTLLLDLAANSWNFAGADGGGDGGWCAADPWDNKFLFGEYVYLRLHRKDDLSNDFHYISGCAWNEQKGDCDWKALPYSIPDAMPDRDGHYNNALFIAPLRWSGRVHEFRRGLWRGGAASGRPWMQKRNRLSGRSLNLRSGILRET